MKKGLGITLLVIVVIVIVGVILIVPNKDKLINLGLNKAIDTIEIAVLESDQLTLPKEKVNEIFKKTRDRIEAGEFKSEKINEIVTDFRSYYEDKKLDSLEVEKIIKTLEGAAQ